MADDVGAALVDTRVLQTGGGKPASFCAKLLADLGAVVVKVVPESRDRVMQDGPFHPRDDTRRHGGLQCYLDVDKESMAQDRCELSPFDVLVEDEQSDPAQMLAIAEPTVIRCSISPFGRHGPYADYAASHLNLFHAGGESAVVPLPGTGWPPLQTGSDVAHYDVGCHAAIAVLAAVVARRVTGKGQSIDVSSQDVLVSENRTTMLRYLHDGVVFDYNTPGYRNSLYPTADGHVIISFGVQEKAVQALAALPDGTVFADARFADGGWRVDGVRELFVERLRSWCAARTTARAVEVLELAGWPVGAVAGPAELLGSEQLRSRAFFRSVDHPLAGSIPVPGRPFRATSYPAPPHSSPPRTTAVDPGAARPPLHGIRVLDFTWAAAGPYATFLLAHLGAEVIKVEHERRIDSARRGFQQPPAHMAVSGAFPYGSRESSPNFNDLAAGKRSVTLDLSSSGAVDLVRRVLPLCDVVVSNFRPGVMDKLGLGAEALLSAQPGVVVAEVSASGSTGPERNRPGYANVFAATGGLSAQTGFVDGPPTEGGDSNDFRCGAAVAFAILAALTARQRTGAGQFVDIACQEVVAAFAPDALLRCVLTAPDLGRIGNHHPRYAPHNVYRAAGTNRWISIVIENDQEWRALCSVINRADLAASHADAARRKADEAHLDAALAAWTTQQDPFAACALLQSKGVRAMPCLSNRDLAESEHLAERGMLRAVAHPVMQRQTVVGPPWFVEPAHRVPHAPAPLLGESNDYLLDELLGLTGDERAEFVTVMD